MKVEIGDTEYKVWFSHEDIADNNIFKIDGRFIFGSMIDHVTTCTIEFFDHSITGKAYKSHKDNFCKATGRKIALTRALKNGGFKRDDRAIFWKRYFEEHKR